MTESLVNDEILQKAHRVVAVNRVGRVLDWALLGLVTLLLLVNAVLYLALADAHDQLSVAERDRKAQACRFQRQSNFLLGIGDVILAPREQQADKIQLLRPKVDAYRSAPKDCNNP